MVMTEGGPRAARHRRSQRLRRPIQLRIVMVLAAIVGVVALLFALRPAPTEAPYTPSPPLALPSGGLAVPTPGTGQEVAAVRIEAPSVGIDLGLVEGDGVHVPINLAAHYPDTAEPGSTGNAVYYAHA